MKLWEKKGKSWTSSCSLPFHENNYFLSLPSLTVLGLLPMAVCLSHYGGAKGKMPAQGRCRFIFYVPCWSLHAEEGELRPLHGHPICSKAENVVTQCIQTRIPHTETRRESNEASVVLALRVACWPACARGVHLPLRSQTPTSTFQVQKRQNGKENIPVVCLEASPQGHGSGHLQLWASLGSWS